MLFTRPVVLVRFHRKHKTLVYVRFLDASKEFYCVNHRKSFGVMIERICCAFIKLLMLWYRNQKPCIKWDSVLSDTFYVCIGINKLFDIYVNTLSISLNEQYIGRCLNVNSVDRHLLCRWPGILIDYWNEWVTKGNIYRFLKIRTQIKWTENGALPLQDRKVGNKTPL